MLRFLGRLLKDCLGKAQRRFGGNPPPPTPDLCVAFLRWSCRSAAVWHIEPSFSTACQRAAALGRFPDIRPCLRDCRVPVHGMPGPV